MSVHYCNYQSNLVNHQACYCRLYLRITNTSWISTTAYQDRSVLSHWIEWISKWKDPEMDRTGNGVFPDAAGIRYLAIITLLIRIAIDSYTTTPMNRSHRRHFKALPTSIFFRHFRVHHIFESYIGTNPYNTG